MALTGFNPTIAQGAHLLVDANPVDASNEPATTDPGSGFQWLSQNPSVTAVPTDNTGVKALVSVVTGAEPGNVQVDVNFKAVAFGPTLTSSFVVTIPEAAAVALQFVADPNQP